MADTAVAVVGDTVPVSPRARFRDDVALLSLSAETGVGEELSTSAALVPSLAAGQDRNAELSGGAEGLAVRTDVGGIQANVVDAVVRLAPDVEEAFVGLGADASERQSGLTLTAFVPG